MSADQSVFVLDSFAVLVYLDGEPGMARVREILAEALLGRCQVALSVINLSEVLYIVERELGLAKAQAALAALEQLPVEILPATREAVLTAAHIKANYPVAYADAFAIAAAFELSGSVLTGDPEFEAVETIVAVESLGE